MALQKKPVVTPKTTKTKKKQPLAAEVELQQRQEELEFNKELARSQAELEVAYRQYTDLYDFAPVGYLTLARNGAIHQVNLAGANLLGANHNEVPRLRLAAFVAGGSYPTFKVFFEKLLSGEGKETCELEMKKKGNGQLWVRLEATCFEGGDVCRAMLTDITERKRMDQVLQESEWRTKIVSELTTDYIFVVDVAPSWILKLRWTSDNLFRLTGRTIEDAATSDLWGNIIHPEDRDHFFGFINQILSSAKAGELECRAFYKNGGERWIRIFARPQAGEGKSVTTIVGAIQDITERKQTEKALEKSEALYHDLVETSQDLIWQCDSESRFTYLNPAWEHVLGYKNEEMLGKKFTDFQTPKAVARDQQEFARLMRGNSVKGLETTYISKSGDKIQLVFNAKFTIGENGRINGTQGTAYDITERKKAEQALWESESLYRNMNENSPLGMHFYKLNDNNQLIFAGANPAADKLLGVDNSQFIGKTIEEAFPPLARTEVPDRYREAAAKGSQWSTEQITYEDTQITGAFEVRAFQTTPRNMVAVFAEITERKQAEQALAAANRELQIALARQQQLAHTDALTGINNRRHLYELAEHEFEIAVRYQQPLSVIMFDIDHFKQVNDTFGHTVGDQILQRVTEVACAELRSVDVIGRYGGEEFVIILPMTNAKNAHPLAERIRTGVAAMCVPTDKGDAAVTISIGIVEMTHGAQIGSIEVMIRNADEAMYAAKQAGRNRTEIGNL